MLDFDPEYNYHSPYMVSKAGSDVVTVHYGSRKWVYDFRKNTVTEGSGGRQIAGVRPGSSSKKPGGLLKGTRSPAGGAAKPEAVRVWEGKLRARAAATAAAGSAPQFKMTLLKATVEFKSLEGDRGEVILQGGGTIAIQWNQLTAADHRNLAVSLAKELAPRQVTVNAVAPGFIKTDMTEVLSDEVKAALLSSIPMGKLGEPDDVAAAVLFLLSHGARYITGQVLAVNGGMAMVG